jgi:hypothetical protein
MITPKEKALEIFTKMFAEWHQIPYESVKAHIEIVGMELSESYFTAKGSAIVAVNEILNIGCVEVPYWYEVKLELEKFGQVGFLAKK